MTNPSYTALYTGVTNDLIRRIYQHKEKAVAGFTSRYNINSLVYYEVFDDAENAILKEKQIKAGSRKKKLELVEGMNPEWRDLSAEL